MSRKIWAIIAGLLAAGSSQAQPGEDPHRKAAPPVEVQTPPMVPAIPDPTQPDPKLRELLSAPKTGLVKQADIRIRGRVLSPERAMVLLEIKDATSSSALKDSDKDLFLLPVGGTAKGVKVLAITVDGVTIEVGPSHEVRVIH